MRRWPEGQDNRSWAFIGEGNPQTGKPTPGSLGEKHRAAGLRVSPAGFSCETEPSEALKAKARTESMGFAICLGHLWSLLMPRDWLWSRSRENELRENENASGWKRAHFVCVNLIKAEAFQQELLCWGKSTNPFKKPPGFQDPVSSQSSLEKLCGLLLFLDSLQIVVCFCWLFLWKASKHEKPFV